MILIWAITHNKYLKCWSYRFILMATLLYFWWSKILNARHMLILLLNCYWQRTKLYFFHHWYCAVTACFPLDYWLYIHGHAIHSLWCHPAECNQDSAEQDRGPVFGKGDATLQCFPCCFDTLVGLTCVQCHRKQPEVKRRGGIDLHAAAGWARAITCFHPQAARINQDYRPQTSSIGGKSIAKWTTWTMSVTGMLNANGMLTGIVMSDAASFLRNAYCLVLVWSQMMYCLQLFSLLPPCGLVAFIWLQFHTTGFQITHAQTSAHKELFVNFKLKHFTF